MQTKDFKHYIEKFDIQRRLDAQHFIGLELLQKGFVKDFPINVIKKLTIDDYIEGKGSKTSFCYRLERQLGEIGNMRGSTAAVFVVYYGKKEKGKEKQNQIMIN